MAVSAVDVLGHDFVFPNDIPDMPASLSAFEGLSVKSSETSDGVKLKCSHMYVARLTMEITFSCSKSR